MKVLADTHVLLWLVDKDSQSRIPEPAMRILLDPSNELVISAITPWEISLKHWLGKLPEVGPLLATWPRTVERLRASVLALTDAHGIEAGRLDWTHKDPFDRMLAAQAILADAALVSADSAFDAVPGLRRIWD